MSGERKSVAELIQQFQAQLADYPFSTAAEAERENIRQPRMVPEEHASYFTALDEPVCLRDEGKSKPNATGSQQRTAGDRADGSRLDRSKDSLSRTTCPAYDSSSSESAEEEGGDKEPFYGDLRLEIELTANNRVLVEESTIVVPRGEVCGLVGRNGAGKTSILRAIRRHGFGVPRGVKVRSIKQEFEPAGDTTLEEYVGPEAGKSLRFLGFSTADYKRPLRSFSGGWRMRAQLARIISEDPDLVLLDEPTNFLDLEAIAFLEEKVREMRRVVIVSHDRSFLDATVSRIFCLENRRIRTYEDANYSAFVAQREAALERQRREYEAQAAERRHLQDFVDRFRYSAKRAAQAQSRLKTLSKMTTIEVPREEPRMRIDFSSRAARGTLLELDAVSFSYTTAMNQRVSGEQQEAKGTKDGLQATQAAYHIDGRDSEKRILRSVSFTVNHTTRAVIVGKNGEGKSTLLRLMGGFLEPGQGRVERAKGLVCGFFTQHHADALDGDARAVDLVAGQIAAADGVAGDGATDSASDYSPGRTKSIEERSRAAMARFGLNVGDQRVRTLSGGQKSRLAFTLLDVQRPSLMILDEPTNHLDADMIEALADALSRFDGAVVCVSHDIAFAERVFKDVYVCEGGTLERFRGTVSEYKELVKAKFRSADF